MSDTLNFSVSKVTILEESNKSQLAKVEIWASADGDNENNLPITREAIENAKDTLYGKPVMAKYDRFRKDFKGHEVDQIAVGVFLEKDDIRLEEVDGKLWVVGKAIIWKKYYPEVMEVFRRKNGKTDVSMECVIHASHKEGTRIVIEAFSFLGVTLLGVQPAIKGSKAVVLEFSKMVQDTESILRFEKDIDLKNSRYEAFDYEFAKDVKEKYPEVWGLYGNVKGDSWFANFSKAIISQNDKGVNKWLIEREDWAEKHFSDDSILGVIAQIKMGVVGSKGMEYQKSIILDQIKKIYPQEFSEKEEDVSMEQELEMGCEMADGEATPEVEATEPAKEEGNGEVVVEIEVEKEPEEDMCAKYQKLESEFEELKRQNTVYMQELESLRQFKAEIEAETEKVQKMSKIEEVLADPKVKAVFSEDEIAQFRTNANDYSFDKLNDWANEVKVSAFAKITIDTKKTEKPSFTKFASAEDNTEKKTGSIWDKKLV